MIQVLHLAICVFLWVDGDLMRQHNLRMLNATHYDEPKPGYRACCFLDSDWSEGVHINSRDNRAAAYVKVLVLRNTIS